MDHFTLYAHSVGRSVQLFLVLVNVFLGSKLSPLSIFVKRLVAFGVKVRRLSLIYSLMHIFSKVHNVQVFGARTNSFAWLSSIGLIDLSSFWHES